MADTIKWGMIGAGDVTEVKSGPAFKKVPGSDLVAVMRRNEEKVKDYAKRHGIARWYTDAEALIHDEEVNAIYIATPPASHCAYCLMALRAGKAVYVEKPMTLHSVEAQELANEVRQRNGKLVVAHYRREQPYFKKIKELLQAGEIGKPRVATLQLFKQALRTQEMADPKMQWRLDETQSGGGLFHDLAPHQLDLMIHFFGTPRKSHGMATNQAKQYAADDLVSGQLLFDHGVLFNGVWAFATHEERDRCELIGSAGKLSFSFFSYEPILLERVQGQQRFAFTPLAHVQQPMIEAVVRYFQHQGENPCPIEAGVKVMHLLEDFTRK
ncbi:Gfo/Idh/MocA family oxidoreductase [Olivibacter ginsenosidimutans]|uniref:Gfo/Idh/MocA family oxidoreductase n=2 Tax=Olivibacter ginsenosidimutans TaxID=1176537 RepID=A0ABP9BXI8_9SPHI